MSILHVVVVTAASAVLFQISKSQRLNTEALLFFGGKLQ